MDELATTLRRLLADLEAFDAGAESEELNEKLGRLYALAEDVRYELQELIAARDGKPPFTLG